MISNLVQVDDALWFLYRFSATCPHSHYSLYIEQSFAGEASNRALAPPHVPKRHKERIYMLQHLAKKKEEK